MNPHRKEFFKISKSLIWHSAQAKQVLGEAINSPFHFCSVIRSQWQHFLIPDLLNLV